MHTTSYICSVFWVWPSAPALVSFDLAVLLLNGKEQRRLLPLISTAYQVSVTTLLFREMLYYSL
ncbi:hypothetical protein [Niallia sp. FSL W8-0954]|uniref:hypothetical protein n=1 Tax=Niallia sp. FSL W8-0954 TaxID=2975338 RepID=UPI0013DE0C33